MGIDLTTIKRGSLLKSPSKDTKQDVTIQEDANQDTTEDKTPPKTPKPSKKGSQNTLQKGDVTSKKAEPKKAPKKEKKTIEPEPKPRGRKASPEEDKQTEKVITYLTKNQKARVEEVCKSQHIGLSQFFRMAILKECDK